MITIFSNPASGSGFGAKNLIFIEKYLREKNLEFVSYVSEYVGQPTELARQHSSESEQIIIIGGDGTFNEVCNGIDDINKHKICFIPSGTGNDFSFALNIEEVESVLENFFSDKSSKTDYLTVNEYRCLNVAGTGLDTDVLQTYNALKKKTRSGYIKSLLKVLLHFKFYSFDITIDDKIKLSGDYMLLACCNGNRIGANILVSPKSKVDDGLINFVAIKKVSRFSIPFILLGFIKGKHLNKPYVEQYLCKKVEIVNKSGSMIFNLDGQLFAGDKMLVNIKEGELITYRGNITKDK